MTEDTGSSDHKQEENKMAKIKSLKDGLVEFVEKDVNKGFDLLEALRKSYQDCILVNDSEGCHVVADTTKLVSRN